MPRIVSLEAGYYRVPLPVTLSDSMHGDMPAFELNTVIVRDADGAEGPGYTAVPNRSYLEAHGFGLDAYIAEPLAIAEGFAVAPDRPGHGIVFDWTGLAAIRA